MIVGEFGRFGGRVIVQVLLVRGHCREIRKLWKELDVADGPRQEEIFSRLAKLGAVRVL
jgi:hypothetical protein